jgi:hypothetical protein
MPEIEDKLRAALAKRSDVVALDPAEYPRESEDQWMYVEFGVSEAVRLDRQAEPGMPPPLEEDLQRLIASIAKMIGDWKITPPDTIPWASPAKPSEVQMYLKLDPFTMLLRAEPHKDGVHWLLTLSLGVAPEIL